ncbi:hypothetical protein JW926_18365 [Candidatus Sumerlaeota bacterium]|nr:hypothetical protein [Candidatus Sumerlaeota bacterium]
MTLNAKTAKRVHGILEKIMEYLDIRFAHAVRVNPNVRHIYADIRWQQLTSLRLILESTKAWGPDRYYVADVLCEDNELRKKSLFLPTDQNSILNEIINLKEQKETARRAGQLPIRDMRTFYSALDPSLERIVELIQTWIWWDLPDACDMVSFEHQYQVLQKVLHLTRLDGPVMDHYQKIFRKTAAEINTRMVKEYEFNRLEQILKRFHERRTLEAGHEMIVKRDVKEDKTLGEPYDYKYSQYSQLENIVEQSRKLASQ